MWNVVCLTDVRRMNLAYVDDLVPEKLQQSAEYLAKQKDQSSSPIVRGSIEWYCHWCFHGSRWQSSPHYNPNQAQLSYFFHSKFTKYLSYDQLLFMCIYPHSFEWSILTFKNVRLLVDTVCTITWFFVVDQTSYLNMFYNVHAWTIGPHLLDFGFLFCSGRCSLANWYIKL